MRIADVEIRNFRGLRWVKLENLADSPLLTLSGRNGAGKSLILLSIFMNWRGDFENIEASRLVGPWGPQARIGMSVLLDPAEWGQAQMFALRTDRSLGIPEDGLVRLTTLIDDLGDVTVGGSASGNEVAADVLRDKRFREKSTFAQIDLIPAERTISRENTATPDPNSLSDNQAELLRTSVQASLVQYQSPFSLWGVQAYLASLDYAEHLEERRGKIGGGRVAGGFQSIADSFAVATGKALGRPELSGDGQIAIFVDAGGGNRHGMALLSSGEQEALGLMYLVQRMSARGGILLLDEPEQHLHPSLQRGLVGLMRGEGSNSQLWLSTHSPGLIAGATLDSLVTLQGAARDQENQAVRVAEETDRIELLFGFGYVAQCMAAGGLRSGCRGDN